MKRQGARFALAAVALFAGFAALAQTAPRFGHAASFVVLGSRSVTSSGPMRITGNVGVSPGETISGLTPANFVLGEMRINDSLARQARSDSNAIDDDLGGRTCRVLGDPRLGGRRLTSGVYCFDAADIVLDGVLVLDAEGDPNAVWIFRITGKLTTLPGAVVLVANGGYDGNVFWRTGGAATIGARTSFIGNLFARGNIEFQNLATLSGRAITRTGSVTLNANRLTLCCAPITVSPAALSNGTLGTPYRRTLTADGGVAPYTFAISSGALPTGLTLDSSGLLQGTVQQAGTFTFTVTATDSAGCAGTTTYTIEIACAERTQLQQATLRAQYAATLFEGGGCTVTQGELPPGLVLRRCTLIGVPERLGTFEFVVQDGSFRSRCFTMEVTACPLDFVEPLPPNGVSCVPYSHTFRVNGNAAPYVFSTAGPVSPPLEGALTLSAEGTLSGTPASAGTYDIPVTVTDALGRSCTRTFTIVIACPPARGMDIVLPDAMAGTGYQAMLPATPCGERPSYSGDAPPGLTVAGGVIFGVPRRSGSQNFFVQSRTSDGCLVTHAALIDVACPELTLSDLPEPSTGEFYDQTVTVRNGFGPYTLTADTLPEGLAIQGQRIVGTPTVPPPYAFTVTALDQTSGCSGQRRYEWCPPMSVVPINGLPDGRAGDDYWAVLGVGGGTAPYTFAVASGSLPPGLTVGNEGRLSGIPTTPGAYAFSVRATDAMGCSATLDVCGMDIGSDDCPQGTNIVLSPSLLPVAAVGVPYEQAITAAGGSTPYAFVLSNGTLPPRLALTETGVIQGTPTATGTYSFTVTAIDENGCLGSRCYTLAVGTFIPTLSRK